MQNIHSFLPTDKNKKKQSELRRCKNGILIMTSVLLALAFFFGLESMRSLGAYAAEVETPAFASDSLMIQEETDGSAQILPIIPGGQKLLPITPGQGYLEILPGVWAKEETKAPEVKKIEDKTKQVKKKQAKTAEKKKTEEKKKPAVQISDKDKKILMRIVEAEATGQGVKGKLLVANVILNRVKSSKFPDTVEGVVFQRSGGKYQFSPVKDGRYYSVTITATTKTAVEKALAGEDLSKGALYFMARKRASQKNINWFDRRLTLVAQYGGHEFFK